MTPDTGDSAVTRCKSGTIALSRRSKGSFDFLNSLRSCNTMCLGSQYPTAKSAPAERSSSNIRHRTACERYM